MFKLPKFLIILIITILATPVIAQEYNEKDTRHYREICKKDLNFFRRQLVNNSAPYANKDDIHFHDWYEKGYADAARLIDGIYDRDDCLYVMKYYVNGFDQSHISIRGYIPLPVEQYPGVLTAKFGKKHVVIYKHPTLEYLKGISIGDQLTHVNDIEIDKFFEDYIEPFYANDNSELTVTAASVYSLILDGNRFKPVASNITIKSKDGVYNIDLKYTELSGEALEAAKKVRQPELNEEFKIELVSNGAWIKIPSFFPTRQEAVYYIGMLTSLKRDIAKEDYILFDLRGNRGGGIRWSIPIIRNLWGDDYIKSLGTNHDYNKPWVKKLRISKENFSEFKKTYDASATKSYNAALKKKESFFIKRWSIFNDPDNLYTNQDSSTFKAKIYVLTDSFCRSTCWTFVNELKQIPGVVHIGRETTIQSIYSYARRDRSPSEHFDFFYPTQMRIQPENNLKTSLIPDFIYKGDMKDEPKVIDWVLSITEKE